MELDDFKKETNDSAGNDFIIDNFIEAIKSETKKQRKLSFYTITILVSLSIIYVSIGIIRENDGFMKLGYGLLISGFLLGAVYIFFRYKMLPDSLYSLPMTTFIDKVEKIISYMNITDYLVIIPILLILGTGGGIIFIIRLLNYTDDLTLLLVIWIIFFSGLCIFGFYAGRKDWYKAHGQLLHEIKRMKESILKS